jgi:hypothetical protein
LSELNEPFATVIYARRAEAGMTTVEARKSARKPSGRPKLRLTTP